MRRDDLSKGLSSVQAALMASRARRVFQMLLRLDRAKDGSMPHEFYLDATTGYSAFCLHAAQFTNINEEILRDYGLEALLDAKAWLGELRPAKNESSFFYRVNIALDSIPILLNLLKRESEKHEIILESAQGKEKKQIQTKKLTFVIRERETPSLTLKDFSTIAHEIENLFQTVANVVGGESLDLVVSALDSGSDKSIEVAGIAAVIDKMSNFLTEAWNSIRFPRSSKTRANIKAASESLTFINEINAACANGALSPEEGEKLKRMALKSVEGLFAMGVYTPEMQRSVPPRPSEVEFQRTKLITHYKDTSSPELACTRFRRHRVRCFYGTGGESWRGEDLRESSSLRRCG